MVVLKVILFLKSTVIKILQCNSSSDFLGVVKYSIISGNGPYPHLFVLHFLSILIPSYIYVNVFNVISYTRTTFIFNDLYNTNMDSGLGFMMLADFYWCFEYLGYLLFVVVYAYVLHYFKKNIYSGKPVHVIISVVLIFLFCNQRQDFGGFIKPAVYIFVFLNILEYYRKKAKICVY